MSPTQKAKVKEQLKAQKKIQPTGNGVESPEFIERAYNRELQKLVKKLEALTVRALKGKIDATFKVEDAKDPVLETLRGLQRRFTFTALATQAASDMVNATDKYNRAAFVADVKKAIGVNVNKILSDKGLQKLLDDRIVENVKLIKSIPKEYFTRVRVAITQGRRKGDLDFSIKKDVDKLLKEVGKIGEITENRAKLIARDQVSKTNSALNEFRQQDIGVTHYTWRTSGDERVREEHKANNGKKFAWKSPPSKTGHPGHDVQCRCIPDPDYSFLKAL
jgi:SPP1 gp7 family putative phage head morphogenesis protein